MAIRTPLPKYPEPLNKDEQRAIHENQTAILEWLKSRGHEIEDEHEQANVGACQQSRL